MEALLCRHDWWHHRPLVVNSIFSPSPLPGGPIGAESSNPLTTCLVPLGTSPILRLFRGPQPAVISLTYKRLLSLWRFQVFYEPCSRKQMKPKYIFHRGTILFPLNVFSVMSAEWSKSRKTAAGEISWKERAKAPHSNCMLKQESEIIPPGNYALSNPQILEWLQGFWWVAAGWLVFWALPFSPSG